MPHLHNARVFLRMFEDHVNDDKMVLKQLREHEIKLKPRKCDLFKTQMWHLIRMKSANVCRMEPAI